MTKVGRNDPCPCGSGKKFKKCCEKKKNTPLSSDRVSVMSNKTSVGSLFHSRVVEKPSSSQDGQEEKKKETK